MLLPEGHTRRSIVGAGVRLLLGSVCHRVLARAAAAVPVQFTPGSKECPSSWTYRQYAVHATITLGAIRILTKKNVGGAAIAIETALDRDKTWTAVQFVAGSLPEHLKGFNRFGATQELIKEERGVVRESGYFSFMTSSPESDMKQARKALNSQGTSQTLTFARGRTTDHGSAFTVEHRTVGGTWTWRNCIGLLAEPGVVSNLPPEQPVAGFGCLPTFLFALQRALARCDTPYEGWYIHNGNVIHLRTHWKAGDGGSDLRMMTGISTQEGHHTEFRLSVDPKRKEPLPEMVEYKARSFLTLTLEAENSSDEPRLRPLLISRV